MTELHGYKLKNTIHKSARTTVYKGIREADGKPVAVKILNSEHPSARDVASFRQEQNIADFGIAAKLSREKTDIVSPGQLEGTLAYLSPEQTGRMNRAVDFRTDFYSLGVTMYEMLTEATPFVSEDPMEMVHSHIALEPEPPCEADPDIPKPVSDIIIKLLAKNAGDRYQGAYGISADLDECLRQLKTSGRISDFPIAAKDVSVKFQIPQKLYGRENEIQMLMSHFESACIGISEIMMVTGFSGVGKSSLVNEMHRPIVGKKGFFISDNDGF